LKKIEVTVSADQSKALEGIFDNDGYFYVKYKSKYSGRSFVIYSVNVPDAFLDKLIDDITSVIDLRLIENVLTVQSVEAYVSTNLDRLKKKAEASLTNKIPLEKLIEDTDPFTRLNTNLVTIALLSSVIALAGLFLDNTLIIIGAMIISPLLGPINAFTVNVSLAQSKKALQSEISILIILVSIIMLSAVITFLTSHLVPLTLTPQITSRGTVSIIYIIIAIILGVAGALAIFTDIQGMLVGIAIAVALVPPAAVTGIGLAYLNLPLLNGALRNTLLNFLGLQLGGISTLKLKGITSRKYKVISRRADLMIIIVIVIHVIVLSIIAGTLLI